jgi:protein-L-isoaspartate(D-aspartate) O-methyltransferase
MIHYRLAREEMVKHQLIRRNISDSLVLDAMRKVPRHKFVEPALRNRAYDDCPLPIGHGQTISQPYIVALMTQSLGLQGGERVLEIGTGSGYQAAILAEIADKVFTMERHGALANQARKVLDELKYANVVMRTGDGSIGWKQFAPYDGIIVTAASPGVPDSLIKQLKEGGRMVIPVGDKYSQDLTIVTRTDEETDIKKVGGCVFVPLVGREGF